MKLGVSTLILGSTMSPEYLTDDVLETFKQNEIRYVETVLPKKLDEWNTSRIKDFNSLVSSYQVAVASLHATVGDLSVAEMKQEVLDRFRRVIRFISDLGGEVYVVHPGQGTVPDDLQRPKFKLQCRKNIESLSTFCREHGVKLVAENVGISTYNRELLERIAPVPSPVDRVGINTSEVMDIIEPLDPDFIGVCLDLGHANIKAGEDVNVAVRRCGKRLFHLHIHDNDGVADRHWLPLQGSIRWRPFMSTIKETGYNGLFMYEIEDKAPGFASIPLTQRLKLISENFSALQKL